MDKLKEALARIRDMWKSLSRLQKGTLIGTVLLLLAAFGGLFTFAGRKEYVPLFSGLTLEDQAAIVEVLKEGKVDYRLDSGASAILVPSDSVYDLRLTLAGSGIPKGGTVGFELFDETRMGMTDFQQQVAYMRALEGELARTIGQIDCVDYARVSVVMPRRKLFLREEQPGSASVLVKLRPGRDMGAEQIRAIMNLTAYSVEGLAPENVSVVDTAGRLLSELVEDDFLVYPGGSGGAVSSVQRELEKMHEHDLERKAQRMLEAVFGPGNAVVRVRVELDFSRRNRTREEYVPQPNGKGVVRSRQVVEETYSGTGTPPVGGGAGTATNIPGYASRQTTAGGSDYVKTDEVTNYEVSTLHQEEMEAPGSVKRITASVMINGSPDEVERRDELFASVAAAIGIDDGRGDLLSLNFMEFAPGPEEATQAAAASRSALSLPLFWVAAPLALVFVGAGVFFFLRRRRRPEGEEDEEGMPIAVEDGKADRRILEGLAHLERGNKDEIYVLEEQIGLYADNNPEDMAVILKQWLDEAY